MAKNTTQLLGIEWMDQLPPMIKAFDAICCSVAEKPSQEENSLAVRLQTEFPNVFKEELGHCSKKKARLLLKSESQPKFCRPRKIPFAYEEITIRELERLVNVQCRSS